MNARAPSWHEMNQAVLAAALDRVFQMLDAAGRKATPGAADSVQAASTTERPATQRDGLSDEHSALSTLASRMGLSAFERDILVLCAGIELESRFVAACEAAFNDRRQTHPTFGLALALLPDAHWSACGRDRPLRYWRLIDIGAGTTLMTSSLTIDERIAHYLVGVDSLDERLEGIVHRCDPPPDDASPAPAFLAPVVTAAARALQGVHGSRTRAPRVALSGRSTRARDDVAAWACRLLGRPRFAMHASDIPSGAAERELVARLWNREARLTDAVLTLQCVDTETASETLRRLAPFVERIDTALLLELPDDTSHASVGAVSIEVPDLQPSQRRTLLETALGPLNGRMNGRVAISAEQFRLDITAIEAVATLTRAVGEADPDAPLDHAFWQFCRHQARASMDQLARRIEPKNDCLHLVMPPPQAEVLSQIAMHVRQRNTVHETWDFAGHCSRGLGITALFAGLPGTGKTMAAEALAVALELDLYQIDLATVASKYIGETAKNLRRIFDAASESGAILLFDEADALFGQRTEVKDSHDRYANFDVSYLLQRMESYRGLAILTTNMKHALDHAFLRRIRFVIDFAFPDAASRTRIWESVYPRATPTEGLDFDKLGRLNVAGGIIHNIAMHAAYLAADESAPVQMRHILRAAHVEYAKLERPLTASETQGWL
ncbi:ATP-binding protein [Burkholderia sp. R-69980]|nr:ATP-binding protein [Burkholderia sp. R-69980]